MGCFLNLFLFLFFFLFKKFHCNHSPSSDVQIFVGSFLWIFPRTGEFGGRNHGSVVASPTLPISSAPENQEETSPCVFWKKIPLLHPARWSQYSKQPIPNSAALSTAQGGTQRDWQGLEGREEHFKGRWSPSAYIRGPAGQPSAHGDAAEHTAAGSSLPAHIPPNHGASQTPSNGKAGGWDGKRDCCGEERAEW